MSDDREAGIAALLYAHAGDKWRQRNYTRQWFCAECDRWLGVGEQPSTHQAEQLLAAHPDLAHQVRAAIPAEPLDVERLAKALYTVDGFGFMPECLEVAEAIAREYAALDGSQDAPVAGERTDG